MPVMAGAAAMAAKDDVEKKVKGVGPYIRAHWKELLALVLAAIPALFIVFHKGARQAAMQAAQPILDAVPGGAGSPGTPAGPSGGGDPGTSIPSPVGAAVSAVAPSATLGISVNGSNPIVGNIAPKSQVTPPAATSPATASSIVARLGANAPGFRDTSQQVATPAPATKVQLLNPLTAVARLISPPPPSPPAPAPVSIPRPTRTGAQSF